MSNFAKAQSLIEALRERGFRISLDDFGAGLSSFAYLKNFQVDTLKIDGSFVRDIAENKVSESMVAAITQVAKVMELETVAEYVETEEARELVADLGVDFAQGHIVGKPAPRSTATGATSPDRSTTPGRRRGSSEYAGFQACRHRQPEFLTLNEPRFVEFASDQHRLLNLFDSKTCQDPAQASYRAGTVVSCTDE